MADTAFKSLICIIVIACGLLILATLGYGILNSPWHVAALSPDGEKMKLSDTIAWIAAMAATVSGVVTTGSFIFLYQTMRAARQQLESAQKLYQLESARAERSSADSDRSYELQLKAMEVQTRPYIDPVEVTAVSTEGRRPEELWVGVKIKNYGQTPATNVKVVIAILQAEECMAVRGGSLVYLPDEDLISIVEAKRLEHPREAMSMGLQSTFPSIGPLAEKDAFAFVPTNIKRVSPVVEALVGSIKYEEHRLFVLIRYESHAEGSYTDLRKFKVTGFEETDDAGHTTFQYRTKPI